MRAAIEIGIHGNEEAESKFGFKLGKSLLENPPALKSSSVIDIFFHHQGAIDTNARHISHSLEDSFPSRYSKASHFAGEDEYETAAEMNGDYSRGQYDVKIAVHHNRYRNGLHVCITPDGSLRVSKRSLAVASYFRTRRVLLIDSAFHKAIGLPGTLDLEIPLSSTANAARQVELYRREFVGLANCEVDELPAVDLSKFTFYTLTHEISRDEAEDLQLQEFGIKNRFQKLPPAAVDRLGLENGLYYAMSWNFNNFSTKDEQGRRTMFGAVVHRGSF
jgi:hypothetical protein